MPIYFEYLVFITVSMSKLRKPTQCSISCAWRVMAVHWPGVVMTAAGIMLLISSVNKDLASAENTL